MKANENYMHRFLDGADKKFIIPVYQRPYSWKKQNCEVLLKDLINIYKNDYKSHFFGSIVYVANEVAKVNEHIIIDGQQRVTTVSLLLLAIRNYILRNKIDIGINIEKITNTYLLDPYADDENKLKLKLVEGDDIAYEKLIDDVEQIENSQVTINYNFFYNEIDKLSLEEIKGVYDSILKLMIVNISLQPSNGDDPQLIFESLNSTGLNLDEADKIRNYILMKMEEKEQRKFYNKYWKTLENKVLRDDLNKFIRYYLATKTYELANENKLYFAFKNYKEKNNIESEELLKDMLEYAKFYEIIKNAKSNLKNYESILYRINKLDVNSCTPLIFNLFKAHKEEKIDDKELYNAFSIIENYIVRRVVCSLPTNQLNKVFVSLGMEIKKHIDTYQTSYYDAFVCALLSKTGKSRFPNNHDFSDKFLTFELYNIKPAVKKYFFERLENYNTKEKIAVEEQIDDGTLTIEHIMPQTLNEEWKVYLGDNWELIHTKYKDTIGNLTLTAYNSDYSNLSFEKKMEMPKKGFKCSKLDLNKSVKCFSEWNEDSIIKRANELCKDAQKIWWMPFSNCTPQVKEEWICWDDEFDFTNMSISKIIFKGDEIKTLDITDAYRKINMRLYDLDSVLYRNMYKKYKLNKSGTTPFKIAEEVYIETSSSSNAKMNLVNKLAEDYKLESQDIQFLVKGKFDINNEQTYSSITVGLLAYNLIGDILARDKVDEYEIEKLKTKEYSKQLFSRTDYPILANNREDNRGNSDVFRYRKNPIIFKGKEIYITTQLFEENREDLISWYRKHL